MATIKSFTSLEQSRKLAEILPLESADMTYDAITEGVRERMIIKDWQANIGLDIAIKENRFSYRYGYMFPCWSLAALLDILPVPQLSKDKLGSGKVGWMVSVYPDNCRYDSCWHDNHVDACYEMIIRLHELKML